MSDISTSKESGAGSDRSGLDRFFSITERNSTVARELRGGLVTFVAMVYIVVLNPIIIGTAKDANGNYLGGMLPDGSPNLAPVAAVTALVAAFFTLLMGIVGRYPFALATGLGLNAFVAFQVASVMSWPAAMGMVVIEGLVITALVLTGFRTAVFHAIPRELKSAIAVGIGLFIALIGLVDAGFVRIGNPLVQLGGPKPNQLEGWPTLTFVVGLLLIAVLMVRKVKGALLIGIAVATVLAVIIEAIAKVGKFKADTNPHGWQLNVPSFDGKEFGTPDLHLVGDFSLGGGFSAVGIVSAIVLVFSLVLSDFFDVMGTTIGLGSEAKLLDEDGTLPRIGPVLFVDGVAAVGGGVAGASSATTYVESAAGIGDGARTGLASVATGLLFVVTIFLSPIAQIVPSEAAAPALVIVGVLLMGQVREIDFRDLSIAIPAFLTIVLMPFTYSITNGVGAGFIAWVVIRAATGRVRTIHPLLWVVSVLFAAYFAIAPLKTLFGID